MPSGALASVYGDIWTRAAAGRRGVAGKIKVCSAAHAGPDGRASMRRERRPHLSRWRKAIYLAAQAVNRSARIVRRLE